ncbi:hypothetical protein [Pseudopedobacter sp.]|uniref:hypothetical protein n=1 Tax=Pseudopedobacter sp. TaxID=1936787 RepID=UPI00333F117E
MYKNLLLSLLLIAANAVSSSQAQEKYSNLHVGFVYPVSSNGKEAAQYTNKVSLHALSGVSYAEEAASFVGLISKVKTNVTGVHIAGLSYLVGDRTAGFLFSGLLNKYTEGQGTQIAGLANLSKKEVTGIQFAGLVNQAGKLEGAQFAGIGNKIDSNVRGQQFAGILNTAANVNGAQFAGILNLAKDTLKGIQFAGIANKANHVKGSQFAGIVNKAKKVSGIQFAGIVNIADSSDYPIAILNFIKNGEKSIGFSIDEQANTLATFRSGGRIMYGILGLGYNLKNEKEIYALQAGIGAHLFSGNKFGLNIEATNIVLESFKKGEFFKNSLTLMPTYKIDKRLDVFAGASINYLSTNTQEGRELTKKFIHTWDGKSENSFQGIFVGGTVGLKLRL